MINLDYKIWETPKGGSTGEQSSLYDCVERLRGNPNEDEIIDPMRIADMDRAVEVIYNAVRDGQRIVVFGDYDVDGVTACAIMINYLEGIGAEAYYKLPNRIEDGYGITTQAVELLKEKDVGLIITVDNGISAHEASQLALDYGIDFVITDHHQPPETLPAASAIVNPKRADDESGYETLSGAGVALCLVAAMEGCTVNDILYEYAELAALGTVCDVMPLNRLNRTIVRAGLTAMNEGPSEGVAAMLTTANRSDREVTAHTLGFTIGPRLNSAGRMEDPQAALLLLLSTDEEEALELAEQLEISNSERRKQELAIIELLTEKAEQQKRNPVLVLFEDDCHEGVIGLAASRLARRYNKPAIVISLNGDVGKGSGRSIVGFSLYDALSACSDLLLGYGGHTLAAGMSISRENCEGFSEAINAYAMSTMSDQKPNIVTADGLICAPITVKEVDKLGRFEPFGQENPMPKFMITDVTIEKITAMKEQHCRLRFCHLGQSYWASFFGRTPATLGYSEGDRIDLMVELSIYSSGSVDSISMLIKEIRPAGMPAEVVHNANLFMKYYYGAKLDDEQKKLLYPDRGFTAKVFRAVNGCSALDGSMLISSFGDQNAGKVLAAMFSLHELDLIYVKNDVIRLTENPKKRSLDESDIIRGLLN